jgi:hypothetical protein
MDSLTVAALICLRARILAKGWRMTEFDWIRVAEIDRRLNETKAG